MLIFLPLFCVSYSISEQQDMPSVDHFSENVWPSSGVVVVKTG